MNWPEGLVPLEMISRASSCEVWDCWDCRRACRVVAKRLREDRLEDAAGERLLAEGELMLSLSHPGLVRAYEVLAAPDPVLVMETLGGQTLSRMIDAEEPLGDGEIAELGLQLCSALGYLHRRGRLHLDLKPSNVIADAGRAKLIDLGIAAAPGDLPPEIGTWCYMAPEQVAGRGVGTAADVWGLGALMFECVCRFAPFDDPCHEGGFSAPGTGSDEWAGHHPQLSREARDVREVREVGPALAGLIASCLTREPGARPGLDGVAATLEELRGGGFRLLSRSLCANGEDVTR